MADGSVIFETGLDTGGIKSALQGVEKSASAWAKNIGKFFSFSAIAAGVARIAKIGVDYNIEMEKYATNFSVMLGDEAAAIEHVAELREMAAKTPFGMSELADASQTMLSFGMDAETTKTAMQQLGDISLGNKERFGQLSLAFAQVSAAGKLTGQDLLQMVNAGFNPLQTIAEKTGTNLGDLKDVMAGKKGSKEFRKQLKAAQKEVKKMGENASEGAKMLVQLGEDGYISAEMIGKAMEMETSTGGRFYNGMEKASQTISGLWSTLQDETAALAGNILEPVTNVLAKGVLETANTVTSALNSLFDEDVSIEVSAEITKAQENLSTLDTDIQALKDKYVTETISINIKADEANTLLDRLGELQSIDKKFLTEADKAEMASISAELAAINPELEKFIGKDGIIRKDAESLKDLTTEYLELAKAQARAAYVADVQARAEEAKIELGVAEEQLKNLRKQQEELGKTAEEWDYYQNAAMEAALGISLGSIKGEDITVFSEKGLSIVDELIKDTEVLTMLSEKFNLSDIFNLEDMSLKSPEELAQSTEALGTLAGIMATLSVYSGEQEGADSDLAKAINAKINAAETAVAEGKATLEASLSELEALMNYIETGGKAENGSSEEDGQTSANALGKNIDVETAQGVSENSGVISDAVNTATGDAATNADTSGFNSVGSEIAGGIAKGISNGTSVVAAAVRRLVQSALEAAESAAEIHSPSRLFAARIGEPIAAGTAVGVSNGSYLLRRAVTDMVKASIPDMRGVASGIINSGNAGYGSAAMAGGFNQTNNFNVPVVSPDEFADTMRMYATYGLQGEG